MRIEQTIQRYIDCIKAYQFGLLGLLHLYAIINKEDSYQTRLNFINEISKCSVYLEILYDLRNKVSAGSNKDIRSVEEFLGLNSATKKNYTAIH